jgi:hypothetical protein
MNLHLDTLCNTSFIVVDKQQKSEEILKCTALVKQFRFMEQAGEYTYLEQLTTICKRMVKTASLEPECTKWA